MMIGRIRINAPVTLLFALLCVVVTAANYVTKGLVNSFCGTVTLQGIFLHVFAHADWDHLFGNMLMFFLLAPMTEEKYGPATFVSMLLASTLCGGLILHFLTPTANIVGASGVVFMLICLSSFTGKAKGFPITAILVVTCYLGREFGAMLFSVDNISQLGHIAGGLVGAILGVWGSHIPKTENTEE